MTSKEKADRKLNCIYAAISIFSTRSKKVNLTTEKILKEAKKLWNWMTNNEDKQ
jgi:hypothetical protein